jgi:hypothetical protein
MWYGIEREHFFAGYSVITTDQIGDQKPCDSLEKAMLEVRIYLNKYNWTAKGAVHESVNFERGQDPMDSMELGDVLGRKMKAAREKMKKGIEEVAVRYWGDEEILKHEDNVYMRFKEKRSKNEYLEIGIEYTPEGPSGSSYYSYIVYVPEPDEELTEWAAGYKTNLKFRGASAILKSPNLKDSEQDEIPFDTFEDAINKMEYWLKNF